MPRRKYNFLPGREDAEVNCFAYYRKGDGTPACRALADIYCLKERAPCTFFATPRHARLARERAERRQH